MQDDPFLKITDKVCLRCGLDKAYHDKKIMKEHVLRCPARKKPYKLRDGSEVHIGMKVWHCHPFMRSDEKIICGMVRFISSGGGLTLWKYPEDRDPARLFRVSHDGHYTASFSCFSSLENAEAFRKKNQR